MQYLSKAAAFVLVVGVAVSGCQLFQSELDETPPVEQPAETAVDQVRYQISDIEALRDRQFDAGLEVVEGEVEGFDRSPLPEAVAEEWTWFERMLFGGREAPLVVDNPSWADRAQFDVDDNRLVFSGDPRDDVDVAFATAMAISDGLDRASSDALPEPETVDAWLTGEIIRRAGPAFTSAVEIASFHGVDVSIEDLAERPELAAQLPGMGPWLESMEREAHPTEMTEPPEGTAYFEEAIQQFVLRKALSVGSALYRSGGWTAVEWGRSEPPAESDQIVHPRRWFEGDGHAQWTWPTEVEQRLDDDGWQQRRQGRVGPAVMALWLEGLVGARAARTIYGGWMDDSYRLYTRGEGEEQEAAFHWVTSWETPHDAQEIASAAEAALGHYLGHEHREQRFRVAVRGLEVAISIFERDQSADELNAIVEANTEAGPGFLPGEAAPFAFEPTLYERYVDETEEAALDLEDEQWIDPAAGWQTGIDSLDGWTVQRSNEAHVRWFANHSDGTLIQWTTELVDPLGEPFGSEEYLEDLAATFAESVSAQDPPEIEVVSEPVDPTIELEVMGMIGDRPQVLRLWQWRRGDVLVSFSLQGPEAFFAERLDESRALLDSLERYQEPVRQQDVEPDAEPIDDDGIIEFEVGDESGD